MRLSEIDWEYVRERSEGFIGRGWVFDALRSFLAGPAGRFVITGLPGTGKTAIAAQLLQVSAGAVAQQEEALGPKHPAGLLPRGVVHAAYLCRAGKVDLLDCAQRLSDQLCEVVEGFDETLRTFLLTQLRTGEIHVQTGDVAPGGSVAGIRVNLGALGPERALTEGVSMPLKRLREKGFTGQVVILVDALDEAMTFKETRELPRLVAEIEHAHVVVTTRADRDVLGQWEGRARILDLIRDAPLGVDDVAEYVSNRLAPVRDLQAREALIARIVAEARGNFLYAYFVLDSLTTTGSLAALRVEEVEGLDLPTGGLGGVYQSFLRRKPMAWSSHYHPVLAPIVVAQGEGLDTGQIVPIATRISGTRYTRTEVRQATRELTQFLEGRRPDGPFRPYHRSFAEFLQDPALNPDFLIDTTEAHEAIVESYLAQDRGEWDGYAWRYLFSHAFAAGKDGSSFRRLYELADSRYLDEKLRSCARFEWVSADYELLFDACAARHDLGRLARYALARCSLASLHSVLETPALLRLLLADADTARVRRTFAEFRSSAELILDPIHKAATLINLYEEAPEWLTDTDEGRVLPEAVRALLQPLPAGYVRDYVITRLAKAVITRRRDQLEWAESLVGSIGTADELSGAWAALAEGYLRWGLEESAVRCLQETLQHLPLTWVFSVHQFFEACAGLQGADALHRLHRAALGVLATATYRKRAELYAIASGLLARAGDAAGAVQWMEEGFRLFRESPEDEWQRALLISEVADAFGQFHDTASVSTLWERFLAALRSLGGYAAKRLAARLAKACVAHVRHGLVAADRALRDVASLGPLELGDYGCRAELKWLIDACQATRSLIALWALQDTLGAMEPARDRARVAAWLVTAWFDLGNLPAAATLFEESWEMLRQSEPQASIGGALALASTPYARGRGLAGSLADDDFQHLLTLKDDFDRATGLQHILDTLETCAYASVAAPLLERAVRECRALERRQSTLSLAAERALALPAPEARSRLGNEIVSVLNAPRITVDVINAAAVAARALAAVGEAGKAETRLRQAVQLYQQSVDERSKWLAGRELARACAGLGDAETLRGLFETTHRFDAKEWCGRLFRNVADALPPGHFTDLLEEEAGALLELLEQVSHPLNQVSVLGNVAHGLSRLPAIDRNRPLLERVEQRLVQAQPSLEMQSSTGREVMLDAWTGVARASLKWGPQGAGLRSLRTVLEWWGMVSAPMDALTAVTLHPDLGHALLAVPDGATRLEYIREAFGQAPFNAVALSTLTWQLCQAMLDERDGRQDEEVVLLCAREIANALPNLPALYERLHRESRNLAYPAVLALSGLAAMLHRWGHLERATALFRQALRVTEKIEYEQMRTWSYQALLTHCPLQSTLRSKVEEAALGDLLTMADMDNRSQVVTAWLATAKIADTAEALTLFRLVKPHRFDPAAWGAMVAAMLRGAEDLAAISSLVLRASSIFSEENVLHAMACMLHEEVTRTGRLDESMLAVLDAELMKVAPEPGASAFRGVLTGVR